MDRIRPISDDIMSIVGNQDLIMEREEKIIGNTMIKIKGFKGWFNMKDFEFID